MQHTSAVGGSQHWKLSLTARRRRAWLMRQHAVGSHIPEPNHKLTPLPDALPQPRERPLRTCYVMLPGGMLDDGQTVLWMAFNVLSDHMH